jgi:hypothetical protein
MRLLLNTPAQAMYVDSVRRSDRHSLQTILPLAGQALGKLLSGIANALADPEFQTGLTNLFAGIASAAQSLAPALGPLGKALGAIGSLLGVFLTGIAPNIAAILSTLAGAVQVLGPALQPVVTLLGQGLPRWATSAVRC